MLPVGRVRHDQALDVGEDGGQRLGVLGGAPPRTPVAGSPARSPGGSPRARSRRGSPPSRRRRRARRPGSRSGSMSPSPATWACVERARRAGVGARQDRLGKLVGHGRKSRGAVGAGPVAAGVAPPRSSIRGRVRPSNVTGSADPPAPSARPGRVDRTGAAAPAAAPTKQPACALRPRPLSAVIPPIVRARRPLGECCASRAPRCRGAPASLRGGRRGAPAAGSPRRHPRRRPRAGHGRGGRTSPGRHRRRPGRGHDLLLPARREPDRRPAPRRTAPVSGRSTAPWATWARVKEAARGANLFVYLGHGNGYPSPYGRFNPREDERPRAQREGGRGHSNVRYFGEYYLRRGLDLAPGPSSSSTTSAMRPARRSPGARTRRARPREAGRQLRRRVPRRRRGRRLRERPLRRGRHPGPLRGHADDQRGVLGLAVDLAPLRLGLPLPANARGHRDPRPVPTGRVLPVRRRGPRLDDHGRWRATWSPSAVAPVPPEPAPRRRRRRSRRRTRRRSRRPTPAAEPTPPDPSRRPTRRRSRPPDPTPEPTPLPEPTPAPDRACGRPVPPSRAVRLWPSTARSSIMRALLPRVLIGGRPDADCGLAHDPLSRGRPDGPPRPPARP